MWKIECRRTTMSGHILPGVSYVNQWEPASNALRVVAPIDAGKKFDSKKEAYRVRDDIAAKNPDGIFDVIFDIDDTTVEQLTKIIEDKKKEEAENLKKIFENSKKEYIDRSNLGAKLQRVGNLFCPFCGDLHITRMHREDGVYLYGGSVNTTVKCKACSGEWVEVIAARVIDINIRLLPAESTSANSPGKSIEIKVK